MSKSSAGWKDHCTPKATAPNGPDIYPGSATSTTAIIHGGPVKMPSDVRDGRPQPHGEILRVKIPPRAAGREVRKKDADSNGSAPS